MPLNRHQFEQAAKHFRAGRLTLSDFADQLFPKPSEPADPSATSGTKENGAKPLASLPERKIDAHKGDLGRVLAIGGSSNMPGAIGLTAMAALRTGSGLVTVATPCAAAATVASYSPCYVTAGYDPAEALTQIKERLEWADVIALGPGLGQDETISALVRQLYETTAQPMVVDADALNCLALSGADLKAHQGQRILTPHLGEFRRLIGSAISNRDEAEKAAHQLARDNDLVLLLKGAGTFVTDGKTTSRNETGNPGMATGGSGDVLTGMVASLIGQGLNPFDAARTAAHLHGRAGDLAAVQLGQTSLISTDLLDFLPAAIKNHPEAN